MARLADGCVGKISGLSTWEVGRPFTHVGTTRTIMYQASFLAAQELEYIFGAEKVCFEQAKFKNTMQRCHVDS